MRNTFIVFLASLLLATLSPAQKGLSLNGNEEKKAEPPPDPVLVISNLVKQVDKELSELDIQPPSANGTYKQEKLKQLRKSVLERRQLLERLAEAQAESKLELPESDPKTGSYALPGLDKLRTTMRARKQTFQRHEEIVENAVQESDYAKKRLLTMQQELRALKELTDITPEQKDRISRLPYDIRHQGQIVELQSLRLKTARRENEPIEKELKAIEQARLRIVKQLRFESKDYNEVLFQLDQREGHLNRQLEKQGLTLRLEEAAPPTPAQLERIRVLHRKQEAIGERQERLPEDRQTWERRYKLHNDKPELSIRLEWKYEADKMAQRLERLLRVKQIRLDELKSAARAATNDEGEILPEAHPDLMIAQAVEEVVTALQRSYDLQLNFLADLDLFSATAGVNTVWAQGKDWLHKAWHYEITSIDDRPVTVRKIFFAILILILGIRIARWLAQRMVHAGLKKAKVDDNTIIAITTLLFYGLTVLVCVIALGSAGIPLTLFTLLGGALAIGLGFGSQNIINNFISGLILLIERPIRVGDMVDVSSTYGKIIRVGLRCTQVRTFNNIDILVPNSAFLETNVVNWTLTDDKTRGELFIGVAYGTPVDRVKAIMMKVAKEHPKILKDPVPEVMFMDFGDNSLLFRLYIWVRMRSPSDRDRVLSDLRFQIDELFHKEGLVIAFPQRDIHLDTLKPLEIRMVKDPAND